MSTENLTATNANILIFISLCDSSPTSPDTKLWCINAVVSRCALPTVQSCLRPQDGR